MRLICITLLTAAAITRLGAQSIELHSPFQRVNPFGEIVTVDRSDSPREILSPEVPRNAHSYFHVSVTVPQNTSYFLYVGTNPPNLVQTRMYKEDFVRVGEEWIPDPLTPVPTPAFGFMPDAMAGVPGQTTRCYLLDVWVPPNADVRRLRVEVLLKVGVWYVAPMEMRIGQAQVPRNLTDGTTGRELAPRMRREDFDQIGRRIDGPAMECLARYLTGQPQEAPPDEIRTVRDVVRRIGWQDMAIASRHASVPPALWFLTANGIVEWWMRNPAFPHRSGGEWYLRVEDWIYRN